VIIKSVNDLEVYNQSLSNLELLYKIFEKVPKSEYDVSHNCKRAAKSIPSNLAEGFAKRSSGPTFKNHLKIRIGSSDEVVAHLKTLNITVSYLKNEFSILAEKYIILSKRLNSLYKNWNYNSPIN
jgi:four helix bundle protein